MKASIFLARRYFLTKKKQNFINILSWIGLSGVALGSASLVIVLSVFNGLEDLLRGLFSSFDPDLKIELVEGRVFKESEISSERLLKTSGVRGVVPVLEDNALVQYRQNNSVVILKGVSSEFTAHSKLNRKIVEGDFEMEKDGVQYALVGRGVQYKLSLVANERFYPMRIMFPKDLKNVRLSPENALNQKSILPSGVFAIEEHFDNNYILVPLAFAQEVFGVNGSISSMDIYLEEGVSMEEMKRKLAGVLPDKFKISTRDEQHVALFRAIRIEKLFVNLAFFFLLLIISFNIFFALSMLALEKKNDLGMLAAMGASPRMVFGIFIIEGLLIGGVGVIIGLGLGGILGYFQEYHGLVSMGIENAVSDAYPLKMEAMDFVISGIVLFLITAFASLNPAISASNISKSHALKIS